MVSGKPTQKITSFRAHRRQPDGHESASVQFQIDDRSMAQCDAKALNRCVYRHLDRVDHEAALAIDRAVAGDTGPAIPILGNPRQMDQRRVAERSRRIEFLQENRRTNRHEHLVQQRDGRQTRPPSFAQAYRDVEPVPRELDRPI
jgi:hypothetical protein